jgi:chromosome segregation ATPase
MSASLKLIEQIEEIDTRLRDFFNRGGYLNDQERALDHLENELKYLISTINQAGENAKNDTQPALDKLLVTIENGRDALREHINDVEKELGEAQQTQTALKAYTTQMVSKKDE